MIQGVAMEELTAQRQQVQQLLHRNIRSVQMPSLPQLPCALLPGLSFSATKTFTFVLLLHAYLWALSNCVTLHGLDAFRS